MIHSHTDRLVRFAARILVFVGVGIFLSLCSYAGSSTKSITADDALEFPITKNSVLRGRFVVIGDLQLEPGVPSAARAPDSLEDIQRCLREGPEWLGTSDDGKELMVTWIPEKDDRVLAMHCDSGAILIGGYRQMAADDDPTTRQAWLFEMLRGIQTSPTRMYLTNTYVVAEGEQYTLNEVRSIDRKSQRIVFFGVSEAGVARLLSAPFAIEGDSPK